MKNALRRLVSTVFIGRLFHGSETESTDDGKLLTE
jgi:hypothetical protein